MANKAKKAARDFMRQFKIRKITADSLEEAMESQGYTIAEFDSEGGSNDDADVLIRELGLADYIKESKGFTYADSSCRIVFINSGLSERERLIVLAHEEGHIYFEHFSKASVIGKDVIEEFEANEFAHYLLISSLSVKVQYYRKPLLIAAGAIAAVAVCVTLSVIKADREYYTDYYVTDTGVKYHLADCMYVKNKDNIRRLTVQEFEAGEYEPCDKCLHEE